MDKNGKKSFIFCIFAEFKKYRTMKKFLALIIILLLGVQMILAQERIAVMGFKAGVGVSQSEVEGLSGMFATGFYDGLQDHNKYIVVERAQINKVIKDLGFTNSGLTDAQMVRVCKNLRVNHIIVGDIVKPAGQYNVDVRVVYIDLYNERVGDVEVPDGGSFNMASFRSDMTSLAKRLAIKFEKIMSSTPAQRPQQQIEPHVIYGYLKVFPNDLGTFDAEPKTVIARLNQSQQYGYGTWRLPTNEELSLMRANNVVGSGNYMTKENKKGIVRLVTDREKGESRAVPVEYVDLGLPSGTLWKDKNESGYYNYDAAIRSFDSKLPTKEQFEELKNSCTWTWTGSGYKLVGPSGEYIILPALGYRTCNEIHYYSVGSIGYYWTSTLYPKSSKVWNLWFSEYGVDMNDCERCLGLSVRLVQD